eukprot:jgi/Orpsp1_1/1177817/evm.model.c7180000062991.1
MNHNQLMPNLPNFSSNGELVGRPGLKKNINETHMKYIPEINKIKCTKKNECIYHDEKGCLNYYSKCEVNFIDYQHQNKSIKAKPEKITENYTGCKFQRKLINVKTERKIENNILYEREVKIFNDNSKEYGQWKKVQNIINSGMISDGIEIFEDIISNGLSLYNNINEFINN